MKWKSGLFEKEAPKKPKLEGLDEIGPLFSLCSFTATCKDQRGADVRGPIYPVQEKINQDKKKIIINLKFIKKKVLFTKKT